MLGDLKVQPQATAAIDLLEGYKETELGLCRRSGR